MVFGTGDFDGWRRQVAMLLITRLLAPPASKEAAKLSQDSLLQAISSPFTELPPNFTDCCLETSFPLLLSVLIIEDLIFWWQVVPPLSTPPLPQGQMEKGQNSCVKTTRLFENRIRKMRNISGELFKNSYFFKSARSKGGAGAETLREGVHKKGGKYSLLSYPPPVWSFFPENIKF